jgi:hypothetical protein
MSEPGPGHAREIVAELDKYVVGQAKAKRALPFPSQSLSAPRGHGGGGRAEEHLMIG